MAQVKHSNGDIELIRVRQVGRQFIGENPAIEPTWNAAAGCWDRVLLVAERSVTYKSNPSRHQCDARCYNAQGRTMQCECSCGGKFHGMGRFNCEAVAA